MFKILADSASDIEKTDADELGVVAVPMKVRFGDVEYSDGYDISHSEFFEKLIESNDLPQTSQINEYDWEEVFAEQTADGSEAIVITISSKLSGTYSSACKAAKKFPGKVYVVDSIQASLGERILVHYAVRLKDQGLTAAEAARELNDKKNKIRLLAVLDTLKYLRKGGRISSFAAIAGEMLSIKPVIAITKGEIKLLGKAMGSKKSNNLLNRLLDECGGIDFDMPYALAYSGLSDALLQKYLRDSESIWKGHAEVCSAYMIGSAIGTHIGPGAISVAFFAK